MSAAPAGAALTGGPGTSVETATEPVFSIVTLVVVGEVLGLVDVPADDLALLGARSSAATVLTR